MNLKETKKFQSVVAGVEVILSHKPRPFGPTYSYQGVVESVKGLNGYCYEVLFTNGRKAYLDWSTKVELV